MDGVPAAMVHDGNIVVTGVSYGNAVVCVQPKRGCAGGQGATARPARYSTTPEIPPTHQYLATYRWLERVFGAMSSSTSEHMETLSFCRGGNLRLLLHDASPTLPSAQSLIFTSTMPTTPP